MNFETLTTIPPENINKFLIFFHVLEIFSKSYEKSVSNGEITRWPQNVQIQTARINSWWKKQKSSKYLLGTEEKSILLEILNLWEYVF